MGFLSMLRRRFGYAVPEATVKLWLLGVNVEERQRWEEFLDCELLARPGREGCYGCELPVGRLAIVLTCPPSFPNVKIECPWTRDLMTLRPAEKVWGGWAELDRQREALRVGAPVMASSSDPEARNARALP